MKNFVILAFVVSFSCLAQGLLPNPRPVPPPHPFVNVRVLRPNEKPPTVAQMKVEARVNGVFATVSTQLELANPNGRALEAELEFPLPDRATVCGYALDVNGVLTDGVVVPKEKARLAFEQEVKRGVDPGLVEQMQGNAFRTRVYPLPAHGSRQVRIDYVAPLVFTANGDAALCLAMPRKQLKERVVSITVPMGGNIPAPKLGGLGDRRFEQAEAVWQTSATDADITPTEDVLVSLPAVPDTLVAVEKVGEECWFAVSQKPPAVEQAAKTPTSWRILWDASGSRAPADVAAALAVIDQLPADAAYELVVFRNEPEPPVTCASRASLKQALAKVPYDGGTDLAALADLCRKSSARDCTLLFTDGMDVLSDGTADFGAAKPVAIVSGAVKDFSALRRLCGGHVIDLAVRKPAEVWQEILHPAPTLARVDGTGFANLQGIGQLASGRVTVIGRLTEDAASIDLFAGRTSRVTINRADARDGRTVATAWAASRVDELASRADDHAEELLAIGRRYGVASPATSLIVFERLDQWLKYDIEPPATATELHAQWERSHPTTAQIEERETNRRERYMHDLRSAWDERVAWWTNPKPKTPKSGLFGESRRGDARNSVESGAMDATMMDMSMDADEAPRAAAAPRAMARSLSASAAMPQSASANAVMGAARRATRVGLKKSFGSAPAHAVSAQVKVQAWDPKTPYLQAIKDACVALGGGKDAAYGEYLVQRKKYASSPAFYLDCAGYFFTAKESKLAVRVLSNLCELRIEDAALLRVCAWRLKEAGEYDLALRILRKVAKMRGEQPFSFRDLAIVHEARGRATHNAADITDALAFYHKTAFTPWKVESGAWTGVVAIEELNALIAWANRQDWNGSPVPKAPKFDEHYRKLLDMDVRIAMEWDTDNTDIDLHVLEPDGEEAYYGHRRTQSGGFVSRDVTTGYGPEEYLKKTGGAGLYKILVHYFASHQQSLLGASTVTATVFTNWGRPEETRQTLSLRLDQARDKVTVGEVTIDPAKKGEAQK